jgi:hypothetical protein
MVCPPTTSEAEARWPRFDLVVVATYSRRDNKDQMIRPQVADLFCEPHETKKQLIEIPPYKIDTLR